MMFMSAEYCEPPFLVFFHFSSIFISISGIHFDICDVQLLRPIYKRMAENHNAEIFAANTLLVVLGTSVMTARVMIEFLTVSSDCIENRNWRMMSHRPKSFHLFIFCSILIRGWHMQAGLSMALGAFLAGLLLAETEFALQVESDIAPYRGLLLGLFFMTVRLCSLNCDDAW